MVAKTRDEALSDILQGQKLLEDGTRVLIALELDESRPDVEQLEAYAAKDLSESIEALKLPQRQYDELDAELREVEFKLAQYRAQADSGGTLGERVGARAMIAAYEPELTILQHKKKQAADALQVFLDTRNKARDTLYAARRARETLEMSRIDGFCSRMGQETEAYQSHRMLSGRMLEMLITNDRSSPEFPRAIEMLEACCLRSGYRTDGTTGRAKLPDNAEIMANAMTAEMPDASSDIPVFPSPADILRQSHVDILPPMEIEANVVRLHHEANAKAEARKRGVVLPLSTQ
jgi:ribosomal protein L29